MSSAALALQDIEKTFKQGREALHVLSGASLQVAGGEMVALVGPSGSGKSTLMHIAGLLEGADRGRIAVGGTDCSKAGDGERTRLRRTAIGFVYQYHHLLPEFSAVENVVLPQMIAGRPRRQARARARELLDLVGLADRAEHRPGQLSGGEQQRVAMARALANDPAVLLADEPTGNLDPHTSDRVFSVLTDLVRRVGLAAVVATHNLELAGQMDRTLRLDEGRLVQV